MSQREYWCFISYRHLDNKQEGRQWATWLHQALETYEVPNELVGTKNDRDEIIPERLFPVFRDEEELATGDLTQRIYEALDRTRTLVVICSPRATQSEHVDKEIRYFKSLKKADTGRRIHACIVDGDPTGDPDTGENCFPEALRHEVEDGTILKDQPASPLGADLRLENGQQGWTTPEAYRRWLEDEANPLPAKELNKKVADHREKLNTSLLKLISGILGVSFGTLQARDKAYQLKVAQARARTLRTWLTVVSVLAVLVISVGIFAYLQAQQMSRADRVASARQSLDLARVLNDEDPLAALKHTLNALPVLEDDDPENLKDAYSRIADVVRSGRWARIGKNVRNVLPIGDGKSLFVLHGDDVGELIRIADLSSAWMLPDTRDISAPWGPNSVWRTLKPASVLDTRDGTLGLSKITGITEIKPPPDNSYWQFLASYNHARGHCSPAFGVCFITSVDDKAEWAAVDSHVDKVDFNTGSVSRVDDVYDLIESPRTEIPCLVTRENRGWYLATAKGKIHLGDKYDFDSKSFSFSPKGLYVFAKGKDNIFIYSCRTADVHLTRNYRKEPVRAAFSTGDTFLMLLIGPRAEIISAPAFSVAAAPTDDFSRISTVQGLAEAPPSWKLATDKGHEIAVYTKHGMQWGLESVDPSGRVAALKADRGEFLDLSKGNRLSIPAVGHAFSPKPDAVFFATFHEQADRRSGRPNQIDRIVFRDIGNPGRILGEIDRPDARDGESEINFGQVGEFVYVTTYSREDSIDPPFRTSYKHETDFFDAKSGKQIGSVPFVAKSCWSSPDRETTLAICKGLTNERDDLHVVLSNAGKAILWVASSDSDKVETVLSSKLKNPQFFVVGFRSTPAEVRRTADGKKIASLSNVITRAEFLPDGRHLVTWYKNGHSELWALSADKAVLLAPFGLIVSDVHAVAGTTLLVRHDDGRAYLIDMAWLSKIQGQTVEQIVQSIRDNRAGPVSSAWWQASHPPHYPWKQPEPASGNSGKSKTNGTVPK